MVWSVVLEGLGGCGTSGGCGLVIPAGLVGVSPYGGLRLLAALKLPSSCDDLIASFVAILLGSRDVGLPVAQPDRVVVPVEAVYAVAQALLIGPQFPESGLDCRVEKICLIDGCFQPIEAGSNRAA